MKFLRLLVTLASIGLLHAQPSPPPLAGDSPIKEKILKNMPPELRKRVEAAHSQAMKDPGVRAAREKAATAMEDVREKTREAMLKADPGLKDAIAKVFPNAKFGESRPKTPGYSGLDAADKARLNQAREAAKGTPKVRAAKSKMDQASTPEERQAASKSYRDAMAAAVREKEPTLAAALQPEGDAAEAR